MKNNKAFTLIEVLAVITLIALLTIVALPLVINQVNKSKRKIDEKVEDLIKEAAYTYIDMNQAKYKEKKGDIYCISLQKLVDYGYLKEPLINPSTKEKIDLTQFVKADFIKDTEAEYTIVSSCEETIN